MQITIFDKLNETSIENLPFPHAVIQNCLETELAEELLHTFPEFKQFNKANAIEGEKLHIPSRISLINEKVHPTWKRLIKEHLNEERIKHCLNSFAPYIRAEHQGLESELGAIEDWRIGQRGVDSHNDFQALVDAQISMHTPCPNARMQERGPHVKIGNKLLVSHCLLRKKEDEGLGGDIELYALKPEAKLLFGAGQQVINKERIQLVKTVQYKSNTAFFFLNTNRSIQTMSPRNFSVHPILYLNVILEISRPLFQLPLFIPGKTASVRQHNSARKEP